MKSLAFLPFPAQNGYHAFVQGVYAVYATHQLVQV